MNRIGIITFWGVPNYGTFLQAYALKNTVQSLDSSISVEVVPYLNDSHYKVYYGISPLECRYKYLNPKYYLSLMKSLLKYSENKKKEKKFLSFYRNLSFTDRISGEELKKREYDTIILGSDIVWDFSIPFFGNDRFLFGLDINSKNKIAYAASFGTTRYGKTIPEYVYKGVNELNAISVRESNSQAIVRVLTGKEPLVVCDPTFLWDFDNDKNIPQENKFGDYIIVYGSSFGQELINGCAEFAKTNNLKIICLDSLDDNYDWCDINIKQNDLSPFEWLAMFKNAKIVMTCTFHGLMFGLIFKKKIAFNPLKFILDKADSFIEYLELNDPLINLTSFDEKVNWNWDYKIINEKLDGLKQKSKDFIEQNLIENR